MLCDAFLVQVLEGQLGGPPRRTLARARRNAVPLRRAVKVVTLLGRRARRGQIRRDRDLLVPRNYEMLRAILWLASDQSRLESALVICKLVFLAELRVDQAWALLTLEENLVGARREHRLEGEVWVIGAARSRRQ